MSDKSSGASFEATAAAVVGAAVGLMAGAASFVPVGKTTTAEAEELADDVEATDGWIDGAVAANALAAPMIITEAKSRIRAFIPNSYWMKAFSLQLVANWCRVIVTRN